MNCRTEGTKECPTPHCCYTRVPTSREEANSRDIAFSVHLALRVASRRLVDERNENYGTSSLPACRSPRRHESDVRAPAAARFKTDPLHDGCGEPPATAVAHGAAMPAWTSNSKSLRIRTCSGWRPAGSPNGGDPHRARRRRADGSNGQRSCLGDQPRPDVVRSSADWCSLAPRPAYTVHGHMQRCGTSVRHPVA